VQIWHVLMFDAPTCALYVPAGHGIKTVVPCGQ
jgi:hypothetical protein